MAVLLERISAELSLIRAHGWDAAWAKALPFCRTEIISPAGYQPTPDDDLLHDILLKFLVRGERSFTTYFAERAIISCYGKLLPIRGCTRR